MGFLGESPPQTLGPPDLLAGLMAPIGSLHFVAPRLFAAQIPRAIPFKLPLVYLSGVVEVACAAGLRRRAPWAGPLAALTLAAIWPANIQMALDAPPGRARSVLWARVPLQLPLVWAALQAKPPA
jgi:uncharacterized membrane protein